MSVAFSVANEIPRQGRTNHTQLCTDSGDQVSSERKSLKGKGRVG
jgi:hypothetical protein